jgi:hypothetical protein
MHVLVCIAMVQLGDECVLFQEDLTPGMPVLGLFTWILSDNRLIGDDVFAGLYGFTRVQLVRGVTIEDVIARIVEEDRERVARETHAAILSGRFHSTTFRVVMKGQVRNIVSYGRCLRDEDDVPHIFTGAVHYAQPQAARPAASTLHYCH